MRDNAVSEKNMTAEQMIRKEMIVKAIAENDDLNWDGDITAENAEEAWNIVMVETDAHWDYMRDFRCGTVETDIPRECSRHYESKSVARQLSDGTWVGWTYWYGGGKYGDPDSIPWMEDAYFLNVTEEQKVVTIQTFTKKATE